MQTSSRRSAACGLAAIVRLLVGDDRGGSPGDDGGRRSGTSSSTTPAGATSAHCLPVEQRVSTGRSRAASVRRCACPAAAERGGRRRLVRPGRGIRPTSRIPLPCDPASRAEPVVVRAAACRSLAVDVLSAGAQPMRPWSWLSAWNVIRRSPERHRMTSGGWLRRQVDASETMIAPCHNCLGEGWG